MYIWVYTVRARYILYAQGHIMQIIERDVQIRRDVFQQEYDVLGNHLNLSIGRFMCKMNQDII